jgi:hypothetical protein
MLVPIDADSVEAARKPSSLAVIAAQAAPHLLPSAPSR